MPPKLEDVGIDYKLSSRAQSIARIPEQKFEQTLSEHREQQKVVTQATMTKLAEQGQRARSEDEIRREKSGRPEWMSVEEFRRGIKVHGYIQLMVEESTTYEPEDTALRCFPDNIVSTVKSDTEQAIAWLQRFSSALGGSHV